MDVHSLPYAGDASSLCGSASLDDLIHHIEGALAHQNFSTIVRECPHICKLVYGSGNPDISGIGATISYLIQTWVTAVTGPLFVLLTLFFRLRHRNRSDSHFPPLRTWWHAPLKTFIKYANEAIIFLSVFILVASTIRLFHNPTFFELQFIQILTFLEITVSSAATYSNFYVFGCRGAVPTALFVYNALVTAFGATIYGISRRSWSHFTGLADACIDDSQFDEYYIEPAALDVAAAIAALITILGLYWALTTLLGTLLGRDLHASLTRTLLRAKASVSKRLGALTLTAVKVLLIVALVAVWFYFCIEALFALISLREDLEAILGEKYREDEFEFGQVMALMVWGPPAQEAILQGYEAYRAYRQKGKSEAPTVHLTQDVAQSHEPAPSLAQAMSAFEHS